MFEFLGWKEHSVERRIAFSAVLRTGKVISEVGTNETVAQKIPAFLRWVYNLGPGTKSALSVIPLNHKDDPDRFLIKIQKIILAYQPDDIGKVREADG